MKPLMGNDLIWVHLALAIATLVALPAYAGLQDTSESRVTLDPDFPAPGFNGVWERDPDKSDDPREKMREAMSAQRGQGGGPGGPGGMPGGSGGMPGPGMGGGGRPPGGPGGPRGGPPSMDDLLTAMESFETALAEGEFKVIDSERVRIYYLDGQKHVRETPQGGKLETLAEMTGNRITIEEKAERGMKVTQTFELGPDGTVLVLTHRLENDRLKEPVVIRSVYDLRDSKTR